MLPDTESMLLQGKGLFSAPDILNKDLVTVTFEISYDLSLV
jgi:hypothetical protein